MNVGNAVERLIALLDVSEKRYPATVAELHVNQACAKLSKDTDMWFDRYVADYIYTVPSTTPTNPNLLGAVQLESLLNFSLGLDVGFIISAYWKLDDGTFKPLDSWNYKELLLTHGEDPGEPCNIGVMNTAAILRPVPESDSTARFEIKGKCRAIGDKETNGWLTHATYAVIYRAAMYACVYMMEDNRLPAFTTMFRDEMETAALHSSMMVTNEPRAGQEPG